MPSLIKELVVAAFVIGVLVATGVGGPLAVLLTAMCEWLIKGVLFGGAIGGVISALTGGSFWEGLENGAFGGAIAGLIFGGMTYGFTGCVAGKCLTFGQTLLTGAGTAAGATFISELGDKLIKGTDISWGKLLLDTTFSAVIGAATAGVIYGISKGISALKLKSSDAPKPRVFESKDPLVGELATKIDQEFPGSVTGVNTPVYRPDGTPLTDLDIELKDVVIQVKSGGGNGLLKQLINSAEATKKIAIAYAPKIKPSVLNNVTNSGFQVFTNIEALLEFIGKILGGH